MRSKDKRLDPDEMLAQAAADYGREVIVQHLGHQTWADATALHYLVQRPPDDRHGRARFEWHTMVQGANGNSSDIIVRQGSFDA